MAVPTYLGLLNPLLRALRELGGSASIVEQEDRVAAILNLSNKELADTHRGNTSKLHTQRTYQRQSRYGSRFDKLRAMAAGVTEHLWEIEDIVKLLDQ